MSLDHRIQRAPRPDRPLRLLIHSEPKHGKTHLAAGAPDALILDCEGGADGHEVDRLPVLDWLTLQQSIEFLLHGNHDYRTLVIDTLDALERRLASWVLRRFSGKTTLADVPYGRGWAALANSWQWLSERLAVLQARRRIDVVILAHSAPVTHEAPRGERWDVWRLRAHKKTQELWLGWCDEVLFLRCQRQAADTGRPPLQRLLECQPSAQWQAGSRRLTADQIALPHAEPLRCWDALRDHYPRGEAPRELPDAEAQAKAAARRVHFRERKARRRLALETWSRQVGCAPRDALLSALPRTRAAELIEHPYESLWRQLGHGDLTHVKRWLQDRERAEEAA